jgi:hypothetical protein
MDARCFDVSDIRVLLALVSRNSRRFEAVFA